MASAKPILNELIRRWKKTRAEIMTIDKKTVRPFAAELMDCTPNGWERSMPAIVDKIRNGRTHVCGAWIKVRG